MSRVIGIDLGTTNSCVAFMEGAIPSVIPNREGSRTTPSIFAVTENGEELVGNIARRQAVTNPQNTIFAVKRLIGKKFSDPTVQEAKRVLPYLVGDAPNGDIRIKVKDKNISSQEVSAKVLMEMKKAAEEYFGEEVREAIITVPAYFNDPQRQATKDAGRMAGLDVLRILNEPTAACLAYNLNENETKTVAVFDLGGGTFDISILRVGEGLFEVVATAGDTFLGGEDFDRLIMDYIIGEFKKSSEIDLSKDRLALQRIKESAEKAKCELSTVNSTEINLPFIAADSTGPRHLVMTFSREKMESLIAPVVQRTIPCCEEALKIAGLNPVQIDEVLLVGGQTRTPLIIKTVENIFGKEPRRDKNPDEVVALGAAVQAGIMSGQVKEIVLLDATPLSLGIATKGDLFVKLIERGTAIPTKKARIFTTVMDNQDTVEVHVFQGEREIASQNISLGKFDLIGVPPAPKGIPQIEVTFDINANGIVSVYAKDMLTGNQQKIIVNPSSGLSESEIERIISESQAKASEDRQNAEMQKTKLKLESLLDSNEKSFHEFGNLLAEDAKIKVSEILKTAKQGLNAGSISKIQEALAELAEASHILAEVILYKPAVQQPQQQHSEKEKK